MRTRGAAALEMRRLSDFELEIETPVETDGSDGESGEDPFWPYGEEEVEGGVDQSEEEDEIHSVRIVQQVKKPSHDHPSQGKPEDEEPEEEGHSAVPRLKIKLKLPTQTSGSVTPVRGYSSPSKSSRRYRPIGAWLVRHNVISHFIHP